MGIAAGGQGCLCCEDSSRWDRAPVVVRHAQDEIVFTEDGGQYLRIPGEPSSARTDGSKEQSQPWMPLSEGSSVTKDAREQTDTETEHTPHNDHSMSEFSVEAQDVPSELPGRGSWKQSKRLHGSGSFDSILSSISQVSTQSGGGASVMLRCGGRHVEDCSVEDILTDVRTYLEESCDVLAAEQLLEVLKQRLGHEWQDIEESELVQSFNQRVQCLHDIGTALCTDVDRWFPVWQDAGGSIVECACDPKDSKLIQYRIKCHIPGRISSAVAVCNEWDLLPCWNSALTEEPQLFGRRTPYHLPGVRYQASLFHGLLKLDFLSEVWRFVDHEASFVAEASMPLQPNSEFFQDTLAGHRRPLSCQRRAWIALGEDACLLVQAGSIRLPVFVNQWLLTKFASQVADQMLRQLRRCVSEAQTPGSSWMQRLKDDKEGLYGTLDRLAAGEASHQRAAEASSPRDVDIPSLFARRPGLLGRRKRLPNSAGRKPRKVVSIAPGAELRSIPDVAGQKEMYLLLAQQHSNLERALKDSGSDKAMRKQGSLERLERTAAR